MTCRGCGKELAKREQAQPMVVGGEKLWPPSFCDACLTPTPRNPPPPPPVEKPPPPWVT